MFLRPKFLEQGDKVAVIATARKVTKEQINYGIEVLESWGLSVVLGKNLFKEEGYLAGSDGERTADLQEAIDDERVKAIFCARGGYGTTRILDLVDFSRLQSHPKWIVGFSDITALHLKLFNMQIESIHATMPALFYSADIDSIDSLEGFLFGKGFKSISAEPNKYNRYGKAVGRLVGGNLSMITDSIGTASEVNTEGRILFIEEIDEYLYKLDKMFVQLGRAGKLSRLVGLVIGQMSEIKDTKVPFGMDVYQIINRHVEKYDYPIGFDFPVGHDPLNLAIPCGKEVTLNITKSQANLF